MNILRLIISNAHVIFPVTFLVVFIAAFVIGIDLDRIVIVLSTPISDAPFAWLVCISLWFVAINGKQ